MTQGILRENQESQGNVLQSSTSGGLNTMSSALDLPLSDSPSMRNTYVNERGNLAKRPGTQQVATYNASANDLAGSSLETLKFRNLPSLLVSKIGTALAIFTVQPTLANNGRKLWDLKSSVNFTGVWSNRAQFVRPDTIQTSEQEPRIIFTTGVNPPVQTRFVQSISFDITYNSVNDDSTVTFRNSNLSNADKNNIFVFEDDVDVTDDVLLTDYKSGPEELDVTLSGDKRNSEMGLVFVSWQWWAEASGVYGNKLYARETRFNTDEFEDKFVNVPTEIIQGIQILDNTGDRPRYPLMLRDSLEYGSYSSPNTSPFYDYTISPDNEQEYVFSKGGEFDSSNDPEVMVGLSQAAFGDVRRSSGNPTQTPEPLHFHRGLPVFFNGERGITGAKMLVKVGDTEYSQNTDETTAKNNSYYLKKSSSLTYFTAPINSSSNRGQYVEFTGQEPTGVPYTDFIQASAKFPKFLGNQALDVKDEFGAGTFIPAYGLWEVADYEEGSFPRTVAQIQGRLVFGGFPKQPLKIAVSEVEDALVPGRKWQNWQTQLSEGLPDEPFQFEVDAGLNDEITAMEEFNNQLFIWTNNNAFRLSSNEGGLRPDNFFVAFQIGLGCVNSRSVTKVENTLYFLNETGVYDIAGTQDASQYAAAEKSLKIRQLIDETKFNDAVAFLNYNPGTSQLLVAVGTDTIEEKQNVYTAQRLLQYNVFRGSWTEVSDVSGRFHSIDSTVLELDEGSSLPLFLKTYWEDSSDLGTNPPSKGQLEILDTVRPVDYILTQTTPGLTTGWTFKLDGIPPKRMTYTLEKGRQFYPVNRDNSQQNKRNLFTLLPHREIEDVKVEIDYEQNGNWQRLAFNEDFVKFRNGTYEEGIYLTSIVPDGNKDIRITKLSQPEDSNWTGDINPVRCWIDNKLQTENQDYTVSYEDTGYVLTFNDSVSDGSVVEVGVLYDTWVYSPKFFRSNMANRKRFIHWYGYFYNDPYNDLIKPEDVNQNSNQDPTQIVETYLKPVGFTLAFNYNDTYTGYTSESDLYGSLELFWDSGFFDIGSPAAQFDEYSRVTEPIIGASYNFQAGLLNLRATFFEMVGYQITLQNNRNTRDRPTSSASNTVFGD